MASGAGMHVHYFLYLHILYSVQSKILALYRYKSAKRKKYSARLIQPATLASPESEV